MENKKNEIKCIPNIVISTHKKGLKNKKSNPQTNRWSHDDYVHF